VSYLNTDDYFASLLGLECKRYQALVGNVKEALCREKEGRVRVGAALYAFFHSVGKRRTSNFYSVCDKVFGLERTQATRYINVIEEFGNEDHSGLAAEYEAYSFSLLMELLTIPREERHKVLPSWSVKNVRELRRVLARSGASEEDDPDAPPPDRFARFKKWKRADLCSRILELEQEVENFKSLTKKGN